MARVTKVELEQTNQDLLRIIGKQARENKDLKEDNKFMQIICLGLLVINFLELLVLMWIFYLK